MKINEIAKQIVSKGKGILAADESTGTMTKRLAGVKVESNEKNRLTFRYTLFTSKNISKYISGVILFDETIRQNKDGKTISEILNNQNIIPGIKVDKGAKKLVGSDETVTEGLDGLRERLKEYYNLGARFAKWRGVYKIDTQYPSQNCIVANAHALARYAAIVQECKMVPIVEPEVLMDGNHSANECLEKTSEVIKECFNELMLHNVDLSGLILKPNMVLAGSDSGDKISGDEVAKLTLECLKNSVPKEVPGIAFLSGGQSEVEATENLNLINKYNNTKFIMTYSYGRALQQSALKYWSNNVEDTKGTQKIFNHRAEMNTLAAQGKWSKDIETAQ